MKQAIAADKVSSAAGVSLLTQGLLAEVLQHPPSPKSLSPPTGPTTPEPVQEPQTHSQLPPLDTDIPPLESLTVKIADLGNGV